MPSLEQFSIDFHNAEPLLILAVVIAAGVIFGFAAKLIRLPSITGQIIAGVIIGKSGFDFFGEEAVQGVTPLTHFALGLIAFTVGAHLNIRRLRNAGKRLFYLLLTESTITPLVVFLALYFIGRQQATHALLFATVAIATAPATIVALVKETQSTGVFVKTLIAAVALNNMACIFLFEVARAIAHPGAPGMSDAAMLSTPLASAAYQLIGAMVIGAVTGLAVEMVAKLTAKTERLATTNMLALLLALGVAHIIGVSPLLACLFMGMLQTNLSANKSHHVDAIFEDFEPVILGIFFTLAGMHLSLEHIALAGLPALLFFFARFGGKLLSADLAMRFANATNRVRKNLGIALIPQAGVAVGLVILIQEDAAFKDFADIFAAVVLAAVTINEIAGPLLTRMALKRAGETKMDRSRLIDFINEENITTDLTADSKEQAIEKLVDLLISSHQLPNANRQAYLQSVLDREKEVTTCFGAGLAIPHGEMAESDQMLGVMGISKKGLDFETPDGKPVHCMVLLATPPHQRQRHLEVLAALARSIGTNPEIQQQLFNADSAAHAYDLLYGEEAVHFNYFLESD